VLAIALGEDHTLVLTSDGIFACGDNGSNQCGPERPEGRNTEVHSIKFPKKEKFVSVAATSYHSMALTGTFFGGNWFFLGETVQREQKEGGIAEV
jgi:alpha-tubulin suppressor-like RCC1 family protein